MLLLELSQTLAETSGRHRDRSLDLSDTRDLWPILVSLVPPLSQPAAGSLTWQLRLAILTTSFRPDSEAVTTTKVLASNKISFRRTICTISPADGTPSCTESTEIESGLLDITPMSLSAADRGKTKDVFLVSLAHRQM